MRRIIILLLFCLLSLLPHIQSSVSAQSLAEKAIKLNIDTTGGSGDCTPEAKNWMDVSGNKVVVNKSDGGCIDVWVYDIATDETIKLGNEEHDSSHKMNAIIEGDMVYWRGLGGVCGYNLTSETLLCDNINADWILRADGSYLAYARRILGQGEEIRVRDYSVSPPNDWIVIDDSRDFDDLYFDISGTKLVWILNGPRTSTGEIPGNLMVTDILTGEEAFLGSSTAYAPRISGELVVYGDWRFHHDTYDGDLFSYNLTTGVERQITNNGKLFWEPAVSGDVIVWADIRSGNSDIYMFDFSSNQEIQLTDDSFEQVTPEIDGDKIIWQDYRNGGHPSYGPGEIYIYSSGFTRLGTNVTVVPDDTTTGDTPVTITFTEVLTEGSTTVTTGEQGPPPGAGFKIGNPPIYYNISTTSEYIGPVTLCMNYEDARFGSETSLNVLHYEDTNDDGVRDKWINRTISLDTDNNLICAEVMSLSPFVIAEPDVIEVSLDIKPESDTNCFNQNEHGVLPVAILGNSWFDISQIDQVSLNLQGLTIKVAGKSDKLLSKFEDVNGDGYIDLVAKFEDSDGWVYTGSGIATLTGFMLDGTPIHGSDTICIVP